MNQSPAANGQNQIQMAPFKDVFMPKVIFGYNGTFHNNIFLHNEQIKIIYPAGNCIVIFNTENNNNSQTFIHPNSGISSISTMTLSPSRR